MAADKCQESINVQSAPLLNLGDVPVGSSTGGLDLLSEEELLKLTRHNTKKNDGGRAGRLRSQIERVCRRFDNMAVEAKLQQRQALKALPIVPPEHAAAVDALARSPSSTSSEEQSAEAPRSCIAAVESLEMNPQGENCFDIEPATNDSIFSSKSMKSVVSSGRLKSVRISTSVSFLEYNSSADNEPMSVSTRNRFQHPTRRDRDEILRRVVAEKSTFPQAKLRRGSINAETDHLDEGGKNTASDNQEGNSAGNLPQQTTSSIPTASPGPTTPAAMKRAKIASTSRRGTSPVRRKATFPAPLRAASQGPARAAATVFVVPSPRGPYGPRSLPK